ncbi:ferredoxin [Micromonospora sp. WMMA1363]|uniref:ferredoxin n=1 Tax=Micromonospora sp. WMMA1363 TaxID=3053985 RepID=UPI00259C7DB3|nr:ferredoxin [Micromonospora sp. WMMA1363]MDM4718668.1 ferredoxin [Micromonospora sp. WMMA1363]
MMRIVVDYDRCDSHGVCADQAPEVFEIRDDDLMYVLVERPSEEQLPLVETAVRGCPKLALSLREK